MKNNLLKIVTIIALSLGLATQPVKAQEVNPIVWKTQYNQLSSSNFAIRLGDQYFYGQEPINISSDMSASHTTLEMIWKENGIDMRMYMYFRHMDTNMWEMYDLRTYNASGTDWIYYSPNDVLGNPTSSLLGNRNYYAQRIFAPTNKSIDAEIICNDCSITAFIPKLVPTSSYGYGIDLRTGLTSDKTITVNTDPMSGYGINAILVDASQKVVTDQDTFQYNWRAENPGYLNIFPQAIPYPNNQCAYDIKAPCPLMNLQISGKNPGVTDVVLDISRKDDGVVIASTSFPVKIIDKSNTSPSPSPSQNTSTEEMKKIQAELDKLQGEVGVIRVQVDQQKVELTFLQRLVENIQNFINSILNIN